MSVPLRLAAFALAAAVAFGAGFGLGEIAGPFDDNTPRRGHASDDRGDAGHDTPHGGDGEEDR